MTKKDLVKQALIDKVLIDLDEIGNRVFVVSENDPKSIKNLRDELLKKLRSDKKI